MTMSVRRRIFIITLCLASLAESSTLSGSNSDVSSRSSSKTKYSQPLYTEDGFKPILKPTNKIASKANNKIFNEDGQFKIFGQKTIFDKVHNNLDIKAIPKLSTTTENYLNTKQRTKAMTLLAALSTSTTTEVNQVKILSSSPKIQISNQPLDFATLKNTAVNVSESVEDIDLYHLEKLLINYIQDVIANGTLELLSAFQGDNTNKTESQTSKELMMDGWSNEDIASLDEIIADQMRRFAEANVIDVNIPRAVESGRLFFLKGLKKFLWPIFIGVQIAKTILLALFLPSILGSLGKMVGKGISSVSGFNHPSETVNDLDFKDNSYNFDQDLKYNDYTYPQPEASTNHFATQMYDAAAANHNNALSRFGFGDQKATHINSGMDADYFPKNNGNHFMPTKKNHFKVFQDIPASSLLLTNYDPFYSPLLSRLDSVFKQLGLDSGSGQCREKLVCLMYATPAKYAPYSNLVSAQLSRELNELRKPTSDNSDILRFFKYMKAAKDGQDGVSCKDTYAECTSFQDSDNPAMITTYHDINKLVQARKIK